MNDHSKGENNMTISIPAIKHVDSNLHMENNLFQMNVNLDILPMNKRDVKRLVQNIKECHDSAANIEYVIKYIDDRIEYNNNVWNYDTWTWSVAKRDKLATKIDKLKKNKKYILEFDQKIKSTY